ncbi:MAG: two-component system LytT family response regulator [Crocinitomix sp.]|jgi:two-component system LytT family response regulator
MISAVIIDDEVNVRNTLKSIILAHDIPLKIIGEADNKINGAELVINAKPDLILLDVMLGEDTSFEMLRIVGEIKSKVIFISGFEQFAIEAFKFSAVDYILKPVDPDELANAVYRVEQQIQTNEASIKLDVLLNNLSTENDQNKKIVLQTLEKTFIIQIQDILRCESNNNYTYFYLKNGEKLLISKPIKQYDELLANYNFFRVHKSHLVNMNFVKGIIKKDGGFIELINADLVPISSRKKEKTLSIINQMGVN